MHFYALYASAIPLLDHFVTEQQQVDIVERLDDSLVKADSLEKA